MRNGLGSRYPYLPDIPERTGKTRFAATATRPPGLDKVPALGVPGPFARDSRPTQAGGNPSPGSIPRSGCARLQFSNCRIHVISTPLFVCGQSTPDVLLDRIRARRAAAGSADRECRRDGDIGRRKLPSARLTRLAGLTARYLFRQIQMQHGAPVYLRCRPSRRSRV